MRVRAFSIAALILLGLPGVAEAQPRSRRPPGSATGRSVSSGPTTAQDSPPRWPFESPLDTASRWLASPSLEDRLLGIARLGSLGKSQALEKLRAILESNPDPRLRLAGVRALAPHAGQPSARQVLVRLMTSPVPSPAASSSSEQEAANTGVASVVYGAEELALLVRKSAALALARSSDREALQILSKVARGEGAAADAARQALRAYSPADFSVLEAGARLATPGWIRTAQLLGDQRAFGTLRESVIRGTPELRAQAALVLTELGDLETVELAQHWVTPRKHSTPILREAGARILCLTHAPGAVAAVKQFLSDEATRELGLSLAAICPHPDLVPALELGLQAAQRGLPEELDRYWLALGRMGGERAATLLAQELNSNRPESRHSTVAFALATSASKFAHHALVLALNRPGTGSHWAVRAAVVREQIFKEKFRGLSARLGVLLGGDSPEERALGSWGLAVQDSARRESLIGSPDLVVARAAAGAGFDLATGSHVLRRLLGAKSELDRTAFGWVLSVPALADQVPTEVLIQWLEPDSGISTLSVLALAARDNEVLRPRLRDLAGSGDPALRAHLALGLGRSTYPGALGLLERMYTFEPNARVRRAILVAVSQRGEPNRRRILEAAADLDGDEQVRESARAALASRIKNPSGLPVLDAPLGTGSRLFWQELTSSKRDAPGVSLELASGLTIPTPADPDGMVVRFALPRTPMGLRFWVARQPGDSKARLP